MRNEPSYNPPNGLADVLDSGPKPIYFGFGVILLMDGLKMTEVILEACWLAEVRVIVSQN
jgi:UDP:flavonoid glycosyltransferase YjiC (YdhE family)